MVLTSWALYRQEQDAPPILLSLDHHTDTHNAFSAATFDTNSFQCNDELAQKLISDIKFSDINSVKKAVACLRNDEHIDAAIKADIISKAFIISYDAAFDEPPSNEEAAYRDKIFGMLPHPERPQRPFTYPDAEIYLVENLCYIGCPRQSHNDDCTIPHYNQAIESPLLMNKLSIMREMCPSFFTDIFFNVPYILDIDLDYFHTCKSILPEDATAFYEIIKGAGLITIATERGFIDEWRELDNNLNVEFLLAQLCAHIKAATDVSTWEGTEGSFLKN